MMTSKEMTLNVNVKIWYQLALLGFISCFIATTSAVEVSGYAGAEYRHFQHQPLFPSQSQHAPSLLLAPEFYVEWHDGQQSVLFSPFLRVSADDAERTHADIRELQWLRVESDWELRVGISKVFWGVVESQHLVDVINQIDLVENIDTEDRLGQPMVNLSFFRDWGTLDLFAMPYFRERTFPGKEGRLRGQLVVDTDAARYESGAGRRHVDWAIRWSQSTGNWDLAVSHFYGTNREPTLSLNDTATALIPFYDIMHQTGLEVQYTADSWLWKLETIRRETETETLSALMGGVEYTFYGIFDSHVDMGLLSEYLFDDRNDGARTPFEDDVFVGTRFTWNDAQSSELLLGFIQDVASEDISWNIEASRRMGQRWTVSLEGRFFDIDDNKSLLYPLRQDDYIQLALTRYF